MFTKLIRRLTGKANPEREQKHFAALGNVEPANPQWQAFNEVLAVQADSHLALALNFNTPDDQKLRALERAGAVLDCLNAVEAVRADAAAARRQLEEQQQAQAQRARH